MATSITISWTGIGSSNVRYVVTGKTEDIGSCSSERHENQTTIIDGSTSYLIEGLEENSCYTITVTAYENNTNVFTDGVTVITLEASK